MTKLVDNIDSLLGNSRFWVLMSGVAFSFLIAGFIQLYIPEGSMQVIRIEQCFGFLSLICLYFALLASPLSKVFPNLPFNSPYLHARRAIGVLAFYYAAIHVYLTFFGQLNGFSGIAYYDARYSISLFAGLLGLAILTVLALTSYDLIIRKMQYKNWKRLQRFVYIAGIVILLHIMIIGPHFNTQSVIGISTYLAVGLLIGLEVTRIIINIKFRAVKGK